MSAVEYLTADQAAELLPFGNGNWVRAQLRAGRLRGSKVGGRWLVEKAAVIEMVESGTNRVEGRRRKRRDMDGAA